MTGSPWIYAVIAASVLLDVFVPVLPSGVLVITAATTAAGTTAADAADLPSAAARQAAQSGHLTEVLSLVLCAAGASVLGDLAAWRLAWRGGDRFDRALARSPKLASAQERLGRALSKGGGTLVVLARFAPAGRSVVSLSAGAAHRRARDFVPWSALAGVAWAAYSVGLGYLGGQWLGTSWLGTAVSVLALFLAGGFAAYLIRREPDTAQPAGPEPADQETLTAAGATLPGPATFPVLPLFLPTMRMVGVPEAATGFPDAAAGFPGDAAGFPDAAAEFSAVATEFSAVASETVSNEAGRAATDVAASEAVASKAVGDETVTNAAPVTSAPA
ncbi:DedA family protein [Streptomyces sp. PU-14G]|uniref:DedA family protein n=1 Tax=Streptomyces sp. PU-14G TaxID=2800808 RepID=UPI0034DF33FB